MNRVECGGSGVGAAPTTSTRGRPRLSAGGASAHPHTASNRTATKVCSWLRDWRVLPNCLELLGLPFRVVGVECRSSDEGQGLSLLPAAPRYPKVAGTALRTSEPPVLPAPRIPRIRFLGLPKMTSCSSLPARTLIGAILTTEPHVRRWMSDRPHALSPSPMVS